jgi:CYTH domain-containing protein
MAQEIERKFLVDTGEVPPGAQARLIAQGYLTDPADSSEVRLRRLGETYVLGLKRGSGLVRTELETEISADNFGALWPATEGARVVKTRYTVELGQYIAYLDHYAESLSGLRTVEVEFASVADAEAFEPPTWFGREVTGLSAYRNQSLAVSGLPDEGSRK